MLAEQLMCHLHVVEQTLELHDARELVRLELVDDEGYVLPEFVIQVLGQEGLYVNRAPKQVHVTLCHHG